MEFIAWLAVIYYLWVGMRYYRRDIMVLLTGKRVKNPSGIADGVADDQGTSDDNTKTKNI
jgi:hypothetical protein